MISVCIYAVVIPWRQDPPGLVGPGGGRLRRYRRRRDSGAALHAGAGRHRWICWGGFYGDLWIYGDF